MIYKVHMIEFDNELITRSDLQQALQDIQVF